MRIQDIKARQRATLDALVAERRRRLPESVDHAAQLTFKREKAAAFRRLPGRRLFSIVTAVLAPVAFGWQLGRKLGRPTHWAP